MIRFLLDYANRVTSRFDVPVEQHPAKHAGCVRCRDYARGFNRAASEAQARAEIHRRARDLGAFTQDEWRDILVLSERWMEEEP